MKTIFAVILALVVSACSNDLFIMMDRTSEPPVETRPEVSSFITPSTLHIAWAPDNGADEYFIYRDIDPSGSFSQLVYRGSETMCEDSNLANGIWYYYKLAKRRGKEIFSPTLYGSGVASMTQKDAYEPNNSKEKATPLVNAIEANIYYFKDGAGNSTEDVDWYSVTVGPRTRYTFKIDTFNGLIDQDITYNRESEPIVTVNLGDEFSIRNYDNSSKTCYFQIAVNRGKFVTDPLFAGGKIGSYRIKFVTTTDVEG